MQETITTQLSGGIGNQLFQYYAGFYISAKTGRKLLLDESRVGQGAFYANRRKAEMPIRGLRGLEGLNADFLINPSISRILSVNKIARSIPVYRKKVTILDFAPNGEIGVKLRAGDLDSIPVEYPQIRLRGNLQSLDIVMEAIKLGALSQLDIKEKTSNVRGILEEMARARPIGIHLRLKDYLGSEEKLVLGQNYYKTAVNSLKNVLPDSPLWLFTDDVDLARKLLPLDVAKMVAQTFGPTEFSDVQTLLLMSRCEGLVIANSTFSFWAAFFMTSPHVVCPVPWFKTEALGSQDVEFQYPESWRQLAW